MIYGLDISSYTTITDPVKTFKEGSQPVDFTYMRGWTGYGDDQKFTAHKKTLLAAVGAGGSILSGCYMWLAYDNGHKAGDVQAESFWNTITAGGVWFNMPPAVDVERRRFLANGTWQYAPLPSVTAYMDHLHKAVDYLTNKNGRRPVLYSNVDLILNYLYPEIVKTTGAWLLECPLWIAHWRVAAPFQGYKPNPWPKERWYFHQVNGDVKDWPGISDVDINKFNGDRAGLKAWCKDASWVPGDVVVEPPIEPPVPPAPGYTAEDMALLDALKAWKNA
jgi:Glycosyl hydrolases family 25